MMFAVVPPNDLRQYFTNALNISIITKISNYLGLPTAVGKSKVRSFSFPLDKLRNKLNIWNNQHISYVSRSTLIKYMALAIPSYVMNLFLLPKSLTDKMESMSARYSWGE